MHRLADGQNGLRDHVNGGVLRGRVELGVNDLNGGTTINLGIEANRNARGNRVKELKEIAAATVDPVIDGNIVNQRLANVGPVGKVGLGQRVVQGAAEARNSVALVKHVVP